MGLMLEQEGLTISSSPTPILRAGFANLIFPLVAVGLTLGNQALTDLRASSWVKAAVLVALCMVALKVYSCALARVYVRNGRTLVLVAAASETTIDVSQVLRVKIRGIPPSMMILLSIRTKSSRWPVLRFFAAPATNLGSYSETRVRLLAGLSEWVERNGQEH